MSQMRTEAPDFTRPTGVPTKNPARIQIDSRITPNHNSLRMASAKVVIGGSK